MKTILLFIPALLLAGACLSLRAQQASSEPLYAIAIHGGAGNIRAIPDSLEEAYTDALRQTLRIGDSLLGAGGSSMDAVEQCIRFMEDCPLFNAGRGAVFNAEGKNELDASVMDGKTLKAGAVAGVTTVKHPVTAARAVMERSSHVLLAGRGAEQFAAEMGLEIVDPSWFFTEQRWKEYLRARAKQDSTAPPDSKRGTVGCVALDIYGNLAAGTSTGGMTMKKYGRVGDSPVIGAGTYADNETCAISATGHGEYFIRNVVAYDISALMKYRGLPLKEAADEVIMKKLKAQGGTGGVIGIDRQGKIAMPFNTSGMFRGWLSVLGNTKTSGIGIYRE